VHLPHVAETKKISTKSHDLTWENNSLDYKNKIYFSTFITKNTFSIKIQLFLNIKAQK
jgi:hypothetical protein